MFLPSGTLLQIRVYQAWISGTEWCFPLMSRQWSGACSQWTRHSTAHLEDTTAHGNYSATLAIGSKCTIVFPLFRSSGQSSGDPANMHCEREKLKVLGLTLLHSTVHVYSKRMMHGKYAA